MWASSHRLGFKTSKERRKGRGRGLGHLFLFPDWMNCSQPPQVPAARHRGLCLQTEPWQVPPSLRCCLASFCATARRMPLLHGGLEKGLRRKSCCICLDCLPFLFTPSCTTRFCIVSSMSPSFNLALIFFYGLYLKIETNSREKNIPLAKHSYKQ